MRTNTIFEHKVFVDDGFSGVSFEREGLQAMLQEVEAGRVATVITKDLSRLGRNYLKTGELIEIVFPETEYAISRSTTELTQRGRITSLPPCGTGLTSFTPATQARKSAQLNRHRRKRRARQRGISIRLYPRPEQPPPPYTRPGNRADCQTGFRYVC